MKKKTYVKPEIHIVPLESELYMELLDKLDIDLESVGQGSNLPPDQSK